MCFSFLSFWPTQLSFLLLILFSCHLPTQWWWGEQAASSFYYVFLKKKKKIFFHLSTWQCLWKSVSVCLERIPHILQETIFSPSFIWTDFKNICSPPPPPSLHFFSFTTAPPPQQTRCLENLAFHTHTSIYDCFSFAQTKSLKHTRIYANILKGRGSLSLSNILNTHSHKNIYTLFINSICLLPQN